MGISFFPYAKYDLNTGNMIGQVGGSGAEALFDFAVNINTLSMLRSLGTISQTKITKVTDKINLCKYTW